MGSGVRVATDTILLYSSSAGNSLKQQQKTKQKNTDSSSLSGDETNI